LWTSHKTQSGTKTHTACDRATTGGGGESGPGTQRRQVSIPFDRLRWIDPQLPYLSRRFQRQMTRRVVIERLHKRMKWDFGEGRLRKRGHESFQATLDKTLFAMHAVLAYG